MTTAADKSLSEIIKEEASDLGFDLCGIAHSKSLKEHLPIIENWCLAGMNGDMNYLGQDIDKRINPGLLFPGAKSVIVAGLNYYTTKKQGGTGLPVISRYAYGVDYHDVIKARLINILEKIKSVRPGTEGRCFVDSAPVLEKVWAREAGLGWLGRHSLLINNKIGSFFFLGIIVINTELEYDKPYSKDNCGSCRLCIDSCPTGAINENRTIDVRRCISYLTVENKSVVPEELALKMEGRVFGCDKCQEVCPWNRNAKENKISEFKISRELELMTAEEWLNLTKDEFNRLFKRSVIVRGTYERLKRNTEKVLKSGK